MTLKIKVSDPALTPTRAHPGDAGLDLRSAEDRTLFPGDRVAVSTGVQVEIPEGFVGYVFARSGNGLRYGVGFPNGVGVVDAGYRGDVKAILTNTGDEVFCIERGDRIAQLVVQPIELPDVEIVDELSTSERGEGGFGSTGR